MASGEMMAEQQSYDAQGKPLAPISYDPQGRPLPAGPTFDPSQPSKPVRTRMGDAMVSQYPAVMGGPVAGEIGLGAIKTIPRTVLELAQWLSQLTGFGDPQKFQAVQDQLAPQSGLESAGAVIGDVVQAIVPLTGVEKAASFVAKSVPIGKQFTKAVVRAAGNAAVAGAQGGDPLTAGVLGAAIPAIGDRLAPGLRAGAEESMVEALGPSGGTGPRTRIQLKQGKQIAPDLLERRFGAMSNKQALAKSRQMLADAKNAVDAAWTGPLPDKDPKRIIDVLQMRRDRLTQIDAATGNRYVPDSVKSVDELLGTLQEEIRMATQPNGKADLRELRRIRENWDNQVNWTQADPSKRGIAPVYRKAADLVRAQINGSDARIAQANKEFSMASKLNDILERTTERGSSSGLRAAAFHYGAPALVGGAIGGYEGGYQGAAEGAAIGATLGKIITTPAFRYVSGNAKAMLARALESGNQTRIGMALTVVTSQIAEAMKGDSGTMPTTATIGTNPDRAILQNQLQETMRQYDAATGADKDALRLKMQNIQRYLEALK